MANIYFRKKNMWKHLSKFSPSLVRLMARRKVSGKSKVEAISNQEIAITADIPIDRVIEISMAFDWSSIPIGEAQSFCSACQFDPFSAADRMFFACVVCFRDFFRDLRLRAAHARAAGVPAAAALRPRLGHHAGAPRAAAGAAVQRDRRGHADYRVARPRCTH